MTTIQINGHKTYYKILAIFEFSSARKRMSVLIEDLQVPEHSQHRYQLLIKGADSVIMARLALKSTDKVHYTQQRVDEFAREGLRTLILGQKYMTKEDVHECLQRIEEANHQIKDRTQKLEEVYESYEDGFELIGSTAIEDRL